MNTKNKAKFEYCNIPYWHEQGITGKGVKVAVIGYGACLLHKKTYIVPVNTILKGSYHDGDELIHYAAPYATIYSLNCMDKNNWSFERCLQWIADNKIDVVCTSIRKTCWSVEEEELSRKAYENGTIMIDSSDNEGKDNSTKYPAKSKYWFSVGAYDDIKEDRAGYSSYGDNLDFLSFTNLFVEAKEGYFIQITHTSGSTQLPTGMAALLKEYCNITPDGLKEFAKKYFVDLREEGRDNETGYGFFKLPNPEEIETIPKEENNAGGNSMKNGIDVSKWQGEINWPKVVADGVKFAFIKATEGQSYIDPQFRRNAAGANAVGLKTGFYHFLRPDNPDPLAEAAHFVETIKGLPVDWLVCDIEDAKGRTAAQVVNYTKRWLQEVERLTGKQPLVYTYVSFANTVLGDDLVNWPLWIAHYGVSKPASTKWADYICWQHTSSGSVAGISGRVDLNYMKEEFYMTDAKRTEFSDVPAGHWSEDNIKKVVDAGIMGGYPDGTFKPDQTVTRAELAAVAVRLLNK